MRIHTRKPAIVSTPGINLDNLAKLWWYYSVELKPGLIAKGQYPEDMPMLPRIMLRRCNPTGTDCLDIGCMEGIASALLARRGAKKVVATDASDHCQSKMAGIKQAYGVQFEYHKQNTVYGMHQQFQGASFDLINLSGLLYHVFSPLIVLTGVRPLLKKNGLLVVCTNVIAEPGYSMEFNANGRMQLEENTFWYPTIQLFDYWLRMLKLAPIDLLYLPHETIIGPLKDKGIHFNKGLNKPSGYCAVVCRAVDTPLPDSDDLWMGPVAQHSWEYNRLTDWKMCTNQTVSTIEYSVPPGPRCVRPATGSVDLWKAAQTLPPVTLTTNLSDTHLLRLKDES